MQNNDRKKLSGDWFGKAGDDYKSAKVVLDEGGYYGTTCFLSQQIAEKYLKGFLVFYNERFHKIHDLVKLLNECKKVDASFKELEEECILLNEYYIETRYPLDAPVDYSKEEAKFALKAVDKIINFVSNNIG